MTKDKDIKREVRVRMKKTGESYTAARAHIMRANPPKSTWAELAGISDAAVKKKTGKDWPAWVKWLDSKNARAKKHPEIAKLVGESYPEIGGWWAQTVTVSYERIRGLREVGQRRGTKAFDASKSKTFPVPLTRLYRAFSEKRRRMKWLGDVDMTIRKSTKDKSMNITWADGTSVRCWFTAKSEEKSSVSIQHVGHATKKKADTAKAFWHERLKDLAKQLS